MPKIFSLVKNYKNRLIHTHNKCRKIQRGPTPKNLSAVVKADIRRRIFQQQEQARRHIRNIFRKYARHLILLRHHVIPDIRSVFCCQFQREIFIGKILQIPKIKHQINEHAAVERRRCRFISVEPDNQNKFIEFYKQQIVKR